MASTLQTTVVVIFNDRTQAERAILELCREGFRDEQIGVVLRGPHPSGPDELPEETTAKVAAGTGVGLLAGASLGGLAAGTLIGLVGGGVLGGAVGGIVGLGIPEDDARYYQQEMDAGRVIVTVQPDGRYDEALEILRREGGREATPPSVRSGVGELP